ncbi:MAG TPA: pitrilysin family protein [Acidobacteriota bacterium]|nr:pitrilysin family protein [Acidobacteriota bacterium]
MNRPILCLVSVAALLLSIGAAVNAQDLDELKYPKLNELKMPEIERVTLENGLRLYLVQDRSLPVFNMSVRINAGAYIEAADKVGLVSILGRTLRTGGTQKWSGDEIDEMLEGVGATVETSGGLVNCNAQVNALSEYTDLGLEVLAEILRRPVFDQDKIDLAKVQERSAIARRNDEPDEIGDREFDKVIYGPESVYARHTEYRTIDAVSRDDLVAFHATYIRPENVQLAIWGDFDKAGIVDKIRQYFGDWERGVSPIPPLPQVDYEYDSKVYFVNKPDVNQSNVYVGHIGGRVTDPDYPARVVMNRVMGGGYSNRMFAAVRSREGLAYAAFGVYIANISYPGVFYNYAATKSESTGKAIKEIIKVIESMHTEPPSKDEMRRAKDGYLNSFVFNFDSKQEVVNRIMNYDFYGLPDDFLQQQKERIETVTADDVVAASKANLRADKLRILVVGNVDDFDIPLEELGLGPVEEIDVTIPAAEEKRELVITPETLAKGKDLLGAAVTAHGGLDNFKSIKSTSVKGTLTLMTPQGEFPIAFEEVSIFPDKRAQVLTVFGQKMFDIQNGRQGWKTDQASMQVVAKTEEDIADDMKSTARNNVVIFRQSDNPDYRPVYDGTGEVNGTSVEFVTLVDADGETICRLGFDADSHQLVCRYYTDITPAGQGTVEEVFVKFTEVAGVRIPTGTVRNLSGQKIGAVEYTEFLVNADIPPGAFDQPQ